MVSKKDVDYFLSIRIVVKIRNCDEDQYPKKIKFLKYLKDWAY